MRQLRQVRSGLYSFLGCKECGDLANSAAFVEGACREVFGPDGSEAECTAAGAGAPTADARAVINATGVIVRGQPPSEVAGVTVPLLGGPPEVRAATTGGPETAAGAPAAVPEAVDADVSEAPEGDNPGAIPRPPLASALRLTNVTHKRMGLWLSLCWPASER